MAPRKRSSQSKGTPSTSPAVSTSHVSADHHHHLRHTGPSISTRTSVGASPSKSPPAPAHPRNPPEGPSAHKYPHEKTGVPVPHATRTSFTKFTFISGVAALLLLGWYIYRMVTPMERLNYEDWWAAIVDGSEGGGITRWETLQGWGWPRFETDRSGDVWEERGGGRGSGDLEGALNALADVLGVSPVQVASAVKPLIPPASLTSIVSKETGGSGAVRILLYEDAMRDRDKKGATGIEEELAESRGKSLDEENAAEGDSAV